MKRRLAIRRDRRKAKQSEYTREGKSKSRVGHGSSGKVSGVNRKPRGRSKAPSGFVKVQGITRYVGRGCIKIEKDVP